MGYAKSKRAALAPSVKSTGTPGFTGDASGLTGIPTSALTGIVGSGLLDPTVLQAATVIVTSATILAMFAAPVTVIPAPGANKVIVVDAILVQTKPTATQYAAGGVVTFQYHGTSVNPHTGSLTAAQVNAAAPGKAIYLGPNTSGAIDLTTAVNLGLDITNATGAFTTGTGTFILTIWYSIVTLG
jgi:hypothetical protein